jgi:hypothetical protein
VEALADGALALLTSAEDKETGDPLRDELELGVYAAVCRQTQVLSDGGVKKPMRYCTALLALLDHLAQRSTQLSSEMCSPGSGSVLARLVLLLEGSPLLQNELRNRISTVVARASSKPAVESESRHSLSTEADPEASPDAEGGCDPPVVSSDDTSVAVLSRRRQGSPRRAEASLAFLPVESVASQLPSPFPDKLLPHSPEQLEPFGPTSLAVRTQLQSSGGLQVVYESTSAAGLGIVSRVEEEELPYPLPATATPVMLLYQHSLTFGSEFESGNLSRAVQRGATEVPYLLTN